MSEDQQAKYESLAELYATVELSARNYDQLQSVGGLFQHLRDSLECCRICARR